MFSQGTLFTFKTKFKSIGLFYHSYSTKNAISKINYDICNVYTCPEDDAEGIHMTISF